jgi:hypothetical protein
MNPRAGKSEGDPPGSLRVPSRRFAAVTAWGDDA